MCSNENIIVIDIMVQERLKHQHWEYSTEIIKPLFVKPVLVSGL